MDFLTELESRNNFCSCANLRQLFDLRKRTEEAERRYFVSYENADLETPQPKHRGFLEDCLRMAGEFEGLKSEYYIELQRRIESRDVFLQTYDSITRKPVSEIFLDEVTFSKQKGLLITANCSVCRTQIEVFD